MLRSSTLTLSFAPLISCPSQGPLILSTGLSQCTPHSIHSIFSILIDLSITMHLYPCEAGMFTILNFPRVTPTRAVCHCPHSWTRTTKKPVTRKHPQGAVQHLAQRYSASDSTPAPSISSSIHQHVHGSEMHECDSETHEHDSYTHPHLLHHLTIPAHNDDRPRRHPYPDARPGLAHSSGPRNGLDHRARRVLPQGRRLRIT